MLAPSARQPEESEAIPGYNEKDSG